MMKAIRVHEFGGPEVMKLEDVPDLQPGPSQVVVRIHAAGVNPVEAYVRSGSYPQKPTLPYTPGTDAGGVVMAVGSGVKGVKAGDRVYTSGPNSGTYAEQVLCGEAQVHRLPDTVSFEQGAAMGVPYGTAYRGLFQRAEAKPAETVLVHGASGARGRHDCLRYCWQRARSRIGKEGRRAPRSQPCVRRLSRRVDDAHRWPWRGRHREAAAQLRSIRVMPWAARRTSVA